MNFRRRSAVFMFAVLMVLTSRVVSGGVPAGERNALIALYNSTGGDNWNNNTNWRKLPGVFNDAGTECTWHGISCDAGATTVESINLPQNNLAGPIPAALGNLPNLMLLRLWQNPLTGSIPAQLGNLSKLRDLRIYSTQLSGPIPAALGNLSQLVWLYLFSNQLTGPIPSQLGNLAKLEFLYLDNNPLGGPIPPQLGNLGRLRELHLHQAFLEGSIPPELGNLLNLRELYLFENNLTGPIPPALGNLVQLESLILRDNPLQGMLPAELGNLNKLTSFALSDTEITGPIPAQFGNLVDLVSLFLYSNQLNGPIPAELGNLSSLQQLFLNENQLEGEIPPELGDLTSLLRLYAGDNQLEGTLPAELGNLPNVTVLDFSSNQLEGPIPAELGQLSTLEFLDLSDNPLASAIPEELGDLQNLETLRLANSELVGTIPPALSKLSNLSELRLSNNQLSGPIPPELGELSKLEFLSLSFNQLEGPIPVELANLQSLFAFQLTDNLITGPIPPQLSELGNLVGFNVANNSLSGAIPPELGSLSNLVYLGLAGNELTGPIPAELGQLTNLEEGTGADLRNNHLYTDSNSLRDFLNSRQVDGGDWESSQTIYRYFAQFADGGGLFSQLVLFSLNDEGTASGTAQVLGGTGSGLPVELNNEALVDGIIDIAIPPTGVVPLVTAGQQEVQQGSVRVITNRHVEGVVIFGGDFGLAGVGSSPGFPIGFVAPIQSNPAQGINTGIALTVLTNAVAAAGEEAIDLDFSLLDAEGNPVAEATTQLSPNGQDALFVDEIPWDAQVDFSDFMGILVVTASDQVTASVIQTRPGEFLTMPVAPLQSTPAGVSGQGAAAPHLLYFAQFADGGGLLASQIMLLNLNGQDPAEVDISLRNNAGGPLTVDLDSVDVSGDTQFEIGPGALRILSTDGLGEIQEGSVRVSSDQPLAGVILFSGTGVGSAGVGSSQLLPEGLVAPMETNTEGGVNTGVALMNLQASEVSIEAELRSKNGQVLATAQVSLPALGHDALFLTEFAWSEEVDFSDFTGLLKLQATGPTAATVIQTRPGQFATMPVAPKPAN